MTKAETLLSTDAAVPRLAIVGSCITRDLWPIRGAGSERLLYISRTSFPSLFAPPVAGFRPARGLPGDLHAHEHAALVADIQKTALARLVAFEPTHVIFDFIDERFDLIAAGDSLASMSGEMDRSGYLAQPAFRTRRLAPRLSSACDRLWREGVGRLAAVIRATPLRNARLILHAARWATHQRLRDGAIAPIRNVELLAGKPVEIAAYNALLERQEATFAELMPPLDRLSAGDWQLADPDHRWGLSPFHYVPEYYDEIRGQMARMGLDRAFSAVSPGALAPDAPSVPAA